MTWQLAATALSALLDTRSSPRCNCSNSLWAGSMRLNRVLNAFTHVDRAGAFAAATAATARQAAGPPGTVGWDPRVSERQYLVAGLPARWGSLLFREHMPDRDDLHRTSATCRRRYHRQDHDSHVGPHR